MSLQVTPNMPAYQFSPFAVPPAVAAAAVAAFAVFLLVTRFSRTGFALFGMSVAAAMWQTASALTFLAADARTALPWSRAGCALVPLLAAAAFQFVATILPRARHRTIISALGWLVAAQLAVLTIATDFVIARVERSQWGFHPAGQTAARVLIALFTAALLAAAIVEIARAWPSSMGTERSRIRLFTIALGIFCLAFVDLLPMYRIDIFPSGWIALLASIGLIVYTATKHGLMPITASLAATEIIRTMRDLLLVCDRDGRIRFANNAAYAFLGCTREEIIGRNLADVLVPTGTTEAASLQGWVRDREYVFRTGMGQPIELTLSHSPVTLEGEVTGAVIIGRDLRDRKRYEWEARRAVTLLQSTLDSTADGILVIGEDGRMLTWNQRFVDMWAIPAELMAQEEDQELIGLLVERLVDPAGFLSSIAALFEHPEAETVNVLELKDGRRLEQYSIGRYLDNAPLRVWSFRDVTARLSAEEGLRDSEARYRLLFEQNAAAVCLVTIHGRIIDCNATFGAMVGIQAEELRGRQLGDVLEDPSTLDDVRRRLDITPTVRGIEIEMRRPDGELVSTLANVSLWGEGERALVHMTAVDISDRKRAEKQVAFQAYHDALTQLPNRRMFVDRLTLSLLSARRVRGNVAVLFIDLDRFKTINDTLGHSVADALLIEIAARLRSCVRQTDTVARHGGDEFTVILPDLHQPEDAAQVAEKILERVAEPVVVGTTSMEISASIGIAIYPHDGLDIDTLLRNADDAMYRAKQAGRNTYQLCTEQMKTRATERLSMQGRLRKAMAEGELLLAYQPRVSLSTGRVVAAEAVVRWNDPERGMVESNEFIPIAEETPLIVPLGEWMLVTACRQIREWRDADLPPMRVTVRVSARQFQQRDLVTIVRRAVADCGIDPALLELEIRESTAVRDLALTVEVLNVIRAAGVTLSIGDFGTESSLGSLRVLPIDAVKIQRGLTVRAPVAVADAAIVDAIIAVGATLGMRVMAEGVDSWEQFDFLKVRGCHEAQGPYFSGLRDSESFKALVQEKVRR